MSQAPAYPAMSIKDANARLTAPGQKFEMAEETIRGSVFRVYKNAPPTLRDLLTFGRTTWRDRVYLVYENERVTYDAHFRAVGQFAKALSEQFGVRKGDRIAIAMRNYPQWSVAFNAAFVLGAIATPLNSWWKSDELSYALADSGARLLVADSRSYSRVEPELGELPALEGVVLARVGDHAPKQAGGVRVLSMESLIGEANDWSGLTDPGLPELALAPDDDATIMYTSGTTGHPKGAVSTHRAIISAMLNSQACLARSFLRVGQAPPQPGPDDPPLVRLVSIPFFHATGAFALLLPAQFAGNRLVTQYKWDADEAMRLIEREKINGVGGVPTIAWQILEHPDREKYDLSSITTVSYGGAPAPPELAAKIRQQFPEAAAGNGWGMTETCATATLNFGTDYVNRPNSAGAPGPAVDLKIIGPDGAEAPTGTVGELWTKGPNNSRAYWNNEEATARTFIDGWVVTGDMAYLDEEGFLFLVDRAKDMLIRGGENIYSTEVEHTLFEHPAVLDVAIVGIPDKVLGEEVGAVVHLAPGKTATAAELRDFVASRLADYKAPKEVIFMKDPLPRNPNGKVLKKDLKALFMLKPA